MAGQPAAVRIAIERVDERQIDRWVAELRRIVVGGQITVVSQVGEFLIDNVYEGLAQAQSHAPAKATSLRRLAERSEEFGMTPSGLARAVPIALQVRQLGRGLADRLGVRHHLALLPVKDPEEKKVLAEAAAEAGWSAEQLQTRVRRVQRPHKGGRPPEPSVVLFVRQLDRALEAAAFEEFRAELPSIEGLEARRLLGRVNAAQAVLERLEKLLMRGAVRKRQAAPR